MNKADINITDSEGDRKPLDLVLDSGHFVTRERPLEVTNAMVWFLNSMLASGLPIFERSKHYGLPTRPVKDPKTQFGVNAVTTKK